MNDNEYVIEFSLFGWVSIKAKSEKEARKKLESMDITDIVEGSEIDLNDFSLTQLEIYKKRR